MSARNVRISCSMAIMPAPHPSHGAAPRTRLPNRPPVPRSCLAGAVRSGGRYASPAMCGLAGRTGTRRGPTRSRCSNGRRAAPSRTGRDRAVPRRAARDGQQPAGDRRPRGRRSADLVRARPLLGDAERRDLQLRRAAPRARGPRPPVRDHLRHRGDRPRVRRVGRRLPATASTATSRSPSGIAGRRNCCLARDRFGIRPLFVAEWGEDFCFASEGKALLRHPLARREIDAVGVVDTFTFWSTLPDRSRLAGIRELPPAHYQLIGPGGHSRRAAGGRSTSRGGPRPTELRRRTRRAPGRRRHACGCAPTSRSRRTSAAASTRRRWPRSPPRRCRAGRCTPSGSGSRTSTSTRAREQESIGRALGVDLHRTRVAARRSPRTCRVSSHSRRSRCCARRRRRCCGSPARSRTRDLKVVLTGEGADELFGGYDIFREDRVRRFWARDPESVKRPLLLRPAEPLPRRRSVACRRVSKPTSTPATCSHRRPALQPPPADDQHSRCLSLLTPRSCTPPRARSTRGAPARPPAGRVHGVVAAGTRAVPGDQRPSSRATCCTHRATAC